MKRLALLALALTSCAPSTQARYQREAEEASAADAAGDYVRAVQIYARWSGTAEDPKISADADARARAAAEKAMAQGEQFEAERAHLKAAQHYERLANVARQYLGDRLTTALARARGAAVEQTLQEARDLETARRWREAVAKYESVEAIAAKLGREAEIANALLAARRSWFDDEVKRGQEAEGRKDWKGAASIYRAIQDLARRTDREGDLRDHLRRVCENWYDEATKRGEQLARSGDWDRALRAYEEAQGPARDLGREAEVERAIADVRVSQGLDRGEKLEGRGRWAEAVRAYEEILPLARRCGREREIEDRLAHVRQRQYEAVLETARQYEQSGDWSRAVQQYRAAEKLAREIGKERDLQERLAGALVSEALAAARALESEGRWSEAIRKVESVSEQAEALGRGREVSDALARARGGWVRAQRKQAAEFERREEYQRAIDALAEIREVARLSGDIESIDEEIARLKGRRFEQALDQARALRDREDYEGALRAYESIRPFARELGRENELATLIRRCREEQFDAYLSSGRDLERAERWEEAIAFYLKARDLAKEVGREEALERLLLRARNGRLNAILADARERERQGDWAGAIAAYERVYPFAEEVGRGEEVAALLAKARDEQGARDFVPDVTEEDSFAMAGDLTATAYDAQGTFFAAADSTGQVWLFDAGQRFSCRHKWDAGNAVRDVTISRDGAHVAACAARTVTVWETGRGRRLRDFEVGGEAHALVFAPDGASVVVAREDGAVEQWDWRSRSCTRVLRGHRSCVNWIGWWSGDAQLVAVCSTGESRWWDWSTGECLSSRRLANGLRSIAFGSRLIALLGSDDTIAVWDPATNESGKRLQMSGATSCAFAGNDRYLLVSDGAGTVMTVDLRTRQVMHTASCHANRAYGLSCHPGGTRYVTCGADRQVKVWVRRRP